MTLECDQQTHNSKPKPKMPPPQGLLTERSILLPGPHLPQSRASAWSGLVFLISRFILSNPLSM
jgi:hypothetical protein